MSGWVRTIDVSRRIGLAPSAVRAIDPLELPYVAVGRRGVRRYRRMDVEAYASDRRVADRRMQERATVHRGPYRQEAEP